MHVCGSLDTWLSHRGTAGQWGQRVGGGPAWGFHVDHQLLQGFLFRVWVQFGVLGPVTEAVSMGLGAGEGWIVSPWL